MGGDSKSVLTKTWLAVLVAALPGVPSARGADASTGGAEHARPTSASGSKIISVDYLEDEGRAMTVDDIVGRTDWTASDARINLGLSSSAFWLRLKIVNREPAARELFLQFADPLLQHVLAYVPDDAGGRTAYRLGFLEAEPYVNPFGGPKLMFPASAVRGVEAVHYVRVQSPSPLALAMSPKNDEVASVEAQHEGWVFGFIYGVMLFMPLYNFVVFLFSRDRAFLILGLFTACLGITFFIVQGHVSLAFPDMSLPVKDRLHHVFGGMTYVLLIVLIRRLLAIKDHMPRLDRALVVLAGATALVPIGVMFGNHYVYALFGMLFCVFNSLVALAISIASLRRTRVAVFFLAGFSFFIAGSVIFVMQVSGGLPSTFWTVHALHFGAIFEEAFLAFAVAFKIRLLNKNLRDRAVELASANVNLSAEMASRERIAKELGVQRSIAIHASKMRALGEVAATIAHQVNNPLAILRMKLDNLAFALKRLDVPVDQRQQLVALFDGTEQNITRIAKITNSLLRLSRNSEREEPVLTPVVRILAEGLDTCIDRFGEKGVGVRQVGLDAVADLELLCHATDVSQAILNLFKNAFDAVYETPGPWIEVNVRLTAADLEIAVTDSGPGIPPELQDKIMQPFFTTKASGKGTGVGLGIAKDLITSSGGTLVLDTDCRNTRFVLRFPLTSCRRRAVDSLSLKDPAVA